MQQRGDEKCSLGVCAAGNGFRLNKYSMGMPTTYRPYQPDQMFLLPPSPKDWLSEDHLV